MARALFLHLPGGGLGMSPWFLGDPGSTPHLLPFGFSGCKTGDLAFWCKPRGSKTKEEPPKVSEPVWSWEEGRRRGLRAPRQLWRDFIMEIIFFVPFCLCTEVEGVERQVMMLHPTLTCLCRVV